MSNRKDIMFRVVADEAANVLKLHFTGSVTAAEMKGYIAPVEAALKKMKPGFQLLTDLSGLEAMDVECLADFRRVMDQCNDKGVATVVRVIPDPAKDIGLNIMSLFHYHRGVRIVTCRTTDEALRALAA